MQAGSGQNGAARGRRSETAAPGSETGGVKGLISVVMPCYQSARYVEAAVSSVLEQSYPRVELVVVDDGSSDASPSIVEGLGKQAPGRVTLLHQDHKGPYPARNRALGHARGEYVAFLDADDWWDRDCLRKLHAALESAGADLAYCGWQNVGKARSGGQPFVPPAPGERDLFAWFLAGCPWPIHAALVRRRVLDRVGGFSERYRTSMDHDLWLRIAAETTRFVRVPEALAFYRWHDAGQISSVRWEQVWHSWRVRKDFIENHPRRVGHLSREALRACTDGFLLDSAYGALWRRDLASAQRLFRKVLANGCWSPRDLRHALPSLLPDGLYRALVAGLDRRVKS